jgi:ADP-ribose pyrophosphatase YjhB (NUDIX family)
MYARGAGPTPPARHAPAQRRPRDLARAAGALARVQLFAGDALIRGAAMFRPPLMLGVRLVAFDAEGRVFLVRHRYLPGWHLPGGAVEAGETTRAAVLREAREEGGLEIDGEPRLLGLYFHRTTGRRDHVAVFVARGARRRAGGGQAGLEISEAGFFEPARLPEETTEATRARIREALGAALPSELW